MPGRHEDVEMSDAAAKRETTMRERLGDVLRPMIACCSCEAVCS